MAIYQSLSEPLLPSTPVQATRDEQLLCELEKMRKNGKLMFYTYACRMLDRSYILTTFTGHTNNDVLTYQLILNELLDELARLNVSILHLNDIGGVHDGTNCLGYLQSRGLHAAVPCTHTTPAEATIVTLNLNDSSIGMDQMEDFLTTGLASLCLGGVLLVQIGSLFPRHTQDMLWRLRQLFYQVRVVKPDTISLYTDSKYIVCLGKEEEAPRAHIQPPLDWYSFLTILENAYTRQKNEHQRAACTLAQDFMTLASGLQVERIEVYLRQILATCLADDNLRKYGTVFCRERKIL